MAGYKVSDKPGKSFTDDIYGTSVQQSPGTTNEYIQAKREIVLEELYKKAIASGANGIINLQIKFISITRDKGVTDWGYEATGMAIKK
ncbi:hypothetical protein DBR40_24660 [Pedobacter sp. KBW01]|nr:hypothetical protein DBR40_24660 [Pedobacter sp. KBW01]